MMDSGLSKLSSTNRTETLLPAMISGWLVHEIPSYFSGCSAQMKTELDLGNKSKSFHILLMTKG